MTSVKPDAKRDDEEGQEEPTPPASEKVTAEEIEDIEERSSPRVPVIYEIVRRHGEEEMRRPIVSLWWSGVAAGLSISFSLLCQALLVMHLPDTDWRPLVTSAGYSVGFLMVIMGRQQLFTENTMTVVLPLMNDFTAGKFVGVARMWGVVLLANVFGTLLAALFCMFTPVLTPEIRATMIGISAEHLDHGWIEMLFLAVPAGFLIATAVWLIPIAQAAQIHVIALITYIIALGKFSHVIVGSMEAFMLVIAGKIGPGWMLIDFFVPALIGNVVGGTVLFAVLAYAQVMNEI